MEMTNETTQNHVSQFRNSFLPWIVEINAKPNPFTAITLKDPMREQTPIHINNVYVEVSAKVSD